MKIIKLVSACLVFTITSALFYSCLENLPEINLVSIEEYLEAYNGDDFSMTDQGLYYRIDEEGTGEYAQEEDILISDVSFYNLRENNIYSTEGNQPWHRTTGSDNIYLTEGMVEAYNLIPVGGKITVLIPSELGYGSEGQALIGVNANEDFKMEIEHLSIKMNIAAYIAENELDSVVSTDSGLHYIIYEEGTGNLPTTGKNISVHYRGSLFDGTVFDSSEGKDPFTFELGAGLVIAGWDEGLAYFKKGGKGVLLIPYELAYGNEGIYDSSADTYAIHPYEPLKFDIEVIDITD